MIDQQTMDQVNALVEEAKQLQKTNPKEAQRISLIAATFILMNMDDEPKENEEPKKEEQKQEEPPKKNNETTIDAITIYNALGPQKALKVMVVAAKAAYLVVKLGYYDFKDWFKYMKEQAGEILMKAGLTGEQVDYFIEMMWDFYYESEEETHKIREWASILKDAEQHTKE